MKLPPPYRMLSMLHGGDLGRIVLSARNHLELLGQRRCFQHERVVAHHLEWAFDVAEDAPSRVRNPRCLPVHQRFRTHDLSSIRFTDCLMAETNTQRRYRLSP